MDKLGKLITQIRKAALSRKHEPRPAHHNATETQAIVSCHHCSMQAVATLQPKPNETEVAGQLVALDCPSMKKENNQPCQH